MSLNIITVTLNMGQWHIYNVFISYVIFSFNMACVFLLLIKHELCLIHNLCSICLLYSVEKYNFLGISIVGQSNERGDGGIYIGSIMKGGAVAADGRIEPGDMLLQVCVCIYKKKEMISARISGTG